VTRIEVSTHIEAPPARVWDVLVDWERQAEWMDDASRVDVLSKQREGVGVLLRCRTDILGFAVNDDLVVTEWTPRLLLGVRHLGWVIRGVAAFELTPTSYGTLVEWWEEADVPLGSVGETLAPPVVVPWVRRVFRRNLANLKRSCERVPQPSA
jgi:uncharacterized protein YndB with AHSA1/START domain